MDNNDMQLGQMIGTWAAVLIALYIGIAQNRISQRIGNIQDSVELYATVAIGTDTSGVPIAPILHIQNVGTRTMYFDRYNFNGRIYELNGEVRPSTYSNAQNNFYWIELPTNAETHVSVSVEYHDVEERKWKSEIIADKQDNGAWRVQTFSSKSNQ